MNAQNNAARVAVQAEPCQKSSGAVALPSVKQTMLTALEFVQSSLEDLVRIRCADENWDEEDVDIDCAVDLALAHIKALRVQLPDDRNEFDRQWFMAAAAINLSVRAFSRTDCHYYRTLTGVRQKFDVLVATVEFVEWQAKTRLPPIERTQEGR